MHYSIVVIGLILALVEVQAKELKKGPEAIAESSNSTSAATAQKAQKRYVTKEVILYLTPSQIEALKAGKGLVSPKSVPQTVEQPKNQLSLEQYQELIQQFENLKIATIASNGKGQSEYVQLPSEIPIYEKEEEQLNKNHQNKFEPVNAWGQNQEIFGDQHNFQYFYPRNQQSQSAEQGSGQVEKENPLNSWLPYNSVLSKKVEEQWRPVLNQNKILLKSLAAANLKDNSLGQLSQIQTEKPLLQTQYAPRHNDQKYAIEVEKFLRDNHRQELEKQSALVQAEAIANSPPILVHHEVKITKHQPVPYVKKVKIEVPTPVLVPVPDPYEVRVPHLYPVPLEIVKHIPVPVKKENNEFQKSPFEVERLIPVSLSKEVYNNAERPFYLRKVVPVQTRKEISQATLGSFGQSDWSY